MSASFQVGSGSVVRLAQLLAELRYLPVHVGSSANQPAPARHRRTAPRDLPAARRRGWRSVPSWPTELRALWIGDNASVLRGAIMAFEAQHGLALNGVPSTALWQALLARAPTASSTQAATATRWPARAARSRSPSTTTGALVLRTPANTGIGGRAPPQGPSRCIERLRSQTMQGTNPDGSHYADFVQWVAYFNGGDAVHYMPRAAYGSPQSLGCIELPYAAAEQAWGYLTYGTLVTVLS